jgi:hypothetical protein
MGGGIAQVAAACGLRRRARRRALDLAERGKKKIAAPSPSRSRRER